jgi:hypothetical protein
MVETEKANKQIEPNIFKPTEKKCNQHDCESEAYSIVAFQDL